MADIKDNIPEEMTVEVVTFTDDEGNDFDMEIIEEFEHAGRRFAVLAEINDECGCGCEEHQHEDDCCCDECAEEALYIFEIVDGEDGEEFVSIDDDDLLEELSDVVESMFDVEE